MPLSCLRINSLRAWPLGAVTGNIVARANAERLIILSDTNEAPGVLDFFCSGLRGEELLLNSQNEKGRAPPREQPTVTKFVPNRGKYTAKWPYFP